MASSEAQLKYGRVLGLERAVQVHLALLLVLYAETFRDVELFIDRDFIKVRILGAYLELELFIGDCVSRKVKRAHEDLYVEVVRLRQAESLIGWIEHDERKVNALFWHVQPGFLDLASG